MEKTSLWVTRIKRAFLVISALLTVACGGGGEPSQNVGSSINLAPDNVKLLQVNSAEVGQIFASWASASDDVTAADKLIYQLHASTDAAFVPNDNTLVFQGTDTFQATVSSGLAEGGSYTVKLRVMDEQGASTVSEGLSVTVAHTPNDGWRSTLYPHTWTPPGSEKNFYTDKLIQDFSYAGYRQSEVAIPAQPPGATFNVTSAPYYADKSGNADATAAIQAAINDASAAGGGVVYLPAGTYRVAPPAGQGHALRVRASRVVLRGDGASRTRIVNTATNMREKAIIKMESGAGNWLSVPSGSPTATLTSDLMGPTQVLPVNSTQGFAVGDMVVVRNTIGDSWIAEHHEDEWLGLGSSFSGMVYLRRIEAINTAAKTITVDIPTRYALKTRDNARIYKAPALIEESGIEELAIGNVQHSQTKGWGEEDHAVVGTGAYDVHASYAIRLQNVHNGWIRKVESYQPTGNTTTAHILSNGIVVMYSRNITIESSHFQRPQYGGGGGNGYMFRLMAQENLVKDTRATFSRHGLVLSHMAASGNVFLRCYDKDTGKQTGNSGSMNTSGQGSDHHMHFSHSNLFDNCTADNSNFQAAYRAFGGVPKHNLTAAHGLYWNTVGKGNHRPWLIHSQQSRFGYVIGTSGSVTAARTVAATPKSEIKTLPVDHTEGIGTGTRLYPASLFEDQLSKRIGQRPGR